MDSLNDKWLGLVIRVSMPVSLVFGRSELSQK